MQQALSRFRHTAQARMAAGATMPPIRAELIGSDTCIALGITVTAYTPVLELCRRLIAAGHDPTTRLEAYRGPTLCLIVRSIGEAAALEPNGEGTGFRRRCRPDAASPMRNSARGAHRPLPAGGRP